MMTPSWKQSGVRWLWLALVVVILDQLAKLAILDGLPSGGPGINVLPFFDEMLDRSDMTIKVTGGCDGAVGARDAELSKAMGEPMCLITSDEFKALAQSDRGALKYIGWMQEDQESHTAIYAKGVGYDWSTQMTPVAGSTFDKVFVSCTDLDDNKVSCADQL